MDLSWVKYWTSGGMDNFDSIEGKIRREPEAGQSRNRLPVRRPAVMKHRSTTKNIIKVSSFN